MFEYVRYFNGANQFTKEGEKVALLSKDTKCICGCSKNSHSQVWGCLGFGRCVNCDCKQFIPFTGLSYEI